jgi:hypothetical protein
VYSNVYSDPAAEMTPPKKSPQRCGDLDVSGNRSGAGVPVPDLVASS